MTDNPVATVIITIVTIIVALEIFKACGANIYDDLTGTNDGFRWYMLDE